MIGVTGDTHGNEDYAKIFKYKKYFVEGDYLIVTGDFGAPWVRDDRVIKKYDKLDFTLLFVDGNHENFDLLQEYEIVEQWGGKVQQISRNIYHLMRGEIYNIEGNKILVMGGASSVDKEDRLEKDENKNRQNRKYKSNKIVKSWWEQEVPNELEIKNLYNNIDKVGNKVDYIITHAIDNEVSIKLNLMSKKVEEYNFNKALKYLREKVKYKKWYCGHYHKDVKLKDERIRVLYNDMIEIGY